MTTYVFGEIEGEPVGSTYIDRNAAMRAGVHQVNMQGISGNASGGANSIVVNGGYEDDEDHGDEIIYTGAGGNDTATKRQIADQQLSRGNAALVVSEEEALPVRVLRGSRGEPAYSPDSGFRYDGLYRVTEHWAETGKSDFRIWRYRLVRLSDEEARPFVPAGNLPAGTVAPGRSRGVVQRTIRNTEVSIAVKRLHDYACQVCGLKFDLPVGEYAEGAHIRGLGRPHNGPDQTDNLLCLCPNHHVLFDHGAIYIDDNFDVRDHAGAVVGPLRLDARHVLNTQHLAYHRKSFGH